jgi:hypothetical protein
MARFVAFLWAASCALTVTAAKNVTYPAMVEVDVVFPRNDTYGPAPVFPFVFAVQNLAAASAITPIEVFWGLIKHGSDQTLGGNQTLDTTDSANLHYANLWTRQLNGTESAGTYELFWNVYYYKCLGEKSNPGTSSGSQGGSFVFTLEAGAQQPDLATVLDACPAQNATIQITDTWSMSASSSQDTCGVIANRHPDANPCAAKLDSAAVSSIAAELTASACAASPPALTSGCLSPTQTTKENAGSRVPAWTGLGMLVGPLLAGLVSLAL